MLDTKQKKRRPREPKKNIEVEENVEKKGTEREEKKTGYFPPLARLTIFANLVHLNTRRVSFFALSLQPLAIYRTGRNTCVRTNPSAKLKFYHIRREMLPRIRRSNPASVSFGAVVCLSNELIVFGDRPTCGAGNLWRFLAMRTLRETLMGSEECRVCVCIVSDVN